MSISNENRSIIRDVWKLSGAQSADQLDWKQALVPLKFTGNDDFKILIENLLLSDQHEGDTA